MWLLEPSAKERNLAHIAMSHPADADNLVSGLIPTLGSAPGCGSVALCPDARAAARSRAAAEAAMVQGLIGEKRKGLSRLEKDLREAQLWKSFQGL